MKLLAIDRSTEVQSVALAVDGKLVGKVLAGENPRSAEWPCEVQDFLSANALSLQDLDAILVGTGPGSFAGIRAAIAFAQGIAAGCGVKVFGLPSSIALALESGGTAVIGDARRELFWLVLYENAKMVADFRLVTREELAAAVPDGYSVVTPDGDRIGDLLSGIFAERFRGNVTPLALRLAEIAVADPRLPVAEPLPVYLSPAVRK